MCLYTCTSTVLKPYKVDIQKHCVCDLLVLKYFYWFLSHLMCIHVTFTFFLYVYNDDIWYIYMNNNEIPYIVT